MEAWSVDEVCKWLVERNLGELVPRFQGESFILPVMWFEPCSCAGVLCREGCFCHLLSACGGKGAVWMRNFVSFPQTGTVSSLPTMLWREAMPTWLQTLGSYFWYRCCVFLLAYGITCVLYSVGHANIKHQLGGSIKTASPERPSISFGH